MTAGEHPASPFDELGPADTRAAAYLVLVGHQPVPAGLRGLRCSHCDRRWPCEARESALDELTGDVPLSGGVFGRGERR